MKRAFDLQQTVINGGLISTAAITLGSPVTGGISGYGTIRLWVGATESNMNNANFKVESNGDVYSKGSFNTQGSFYIRDVNGNIDGGFSASYYAPAGAGRPSFGSTRMWIGGASPSEGAIKLESSGRGYFYDICVGDGTLNGSSMLTWDVLHVGSQYRSPSQRPRLGADGNSQYPPLLLLKTGERTSPSHIPLFEVSGQKYSTEWFNRTIIKCAWMPLKTHLSSLGFSDVGADGIVFLKYDIRNGVIFTEGNTNL